MMFIYLLGIKRRVSYSACKTLELNTHLGLDT